MSDCMTQEDAENMNNEQAINILTPLMKMLLDQYGCPISDAFFALKKAIEVLSAQQWIPCSERMPEEGFYLVTLASIDPYINDDYRNHTFFANYHNKKWRFDIFSKYINNFYYVIAWMPLPEPLA